ncbi:GGDEF domain-containing protein [Comamonas sp. GB3 AK4-5]|uniref:GGDEF domain-containing protein n=1 Tax=Comamonas sp. GB3 AK4-5 TaxID=3231487 RepID=UPI00351F114E
MQILQNLVEMTGHRDHLRLEVSVLSTLQQLPHVTYVRALELSEMPEGWVVRPRTWSEGGEMVTSGSDALADTQSQPLHSIAPLAEGIAQALSSFSHSYPGRRYVLWLPVWMHNKARTCVEITQSRPFSARRMEVLMSIFRVYQNYQSLLDYSERDALTGLLNRKTFEEQFIRFASLAANAPISLPELTGSSELPQQWLAVVDIDHFKQVNDRYGHLFGDEVLILVANLLRTSFRAQDRIFRFGGEEFVILLRSVTLQDAQQIFERFRRNVEAHPFPQIGQVTVSLGFSSTRLCSPVEIIGQSDQALYFAKQNGRNRVCHYESLLSEGNLGLKVAHEDIELF